MGQKVIITVGFGGNLRYRPETISADLSSTTHV